MVSTGERGLSERRHARRTASHRFTTRLRRSPPSTRPPTSRCRYLDRDCYLQRRRPTGSRLEPAADRGGSPRSAGLVVESALLRSLVAVEHAAPAYFPDEYTAALGSLPLARHAGAGARAGRARAFPRPCSVSVLAAPLWGIFPPFAAYHMIQILNATLMSLAAVPIYLLARRLDLGSGYALRLCRLLGRGFPSSRSRVRSSPTRSAIRSRSRRWPQASSRSRRAPDAPSSPSSRCAGLATRSRRAQHILPRPGLHPRRRHPRSPPLRPPPPPSARGVHSPRRRGRGRALVPAGSSGSTRCGSPSARRVEPRALAGADLASAPPWPEASFSSLAPSLVSARVAGEREVAFSAFVLPFSIGLLRSRPRSTQPTAATDSRSATPS